MNATQTRLLSLLLFAGLCATATYWTVTLTARDPGLPAAAAPAPLNGEDAAALFGGQLTHNPLQDIHLVGILSLTHGAAAIIGTSDEAPRAIGLNGEISPGTTLAEVRDRSVIVSHNGARSEVFLPAAPSGPTVYVR